MTRKWLIPVLALIGVVMAVALVFRNPEPARVVGTGGLSARAPYASYLAGAGLIEASTENVAIGTPVSGIVTDVFIKWGDSVAVGEPLFKVDDRDLQAQLVPLLARVAESKVSLAKAKHLLNVAKELGETRAISRQDIITLSLDADISAAALTSAQASVEQVKIETARRTIVAPISGRILQIKIRPGEFAQNGVVDPPLMLLGDDTRLHVRVEIDENLAWRFDATAPATAFVRGNPESSVELQFERVEPYVVPKTSLTGSSTERPDTRVLQVIYGFERKELPVYVGQQVDVFIQAPVVRAPRKDTP
jgi:RND family efflux transporter MFP subunit